MAELITDDSPASAACTNVPGAQHDYRPYEYSQYGKPRTSWRCVWCHVVACGDYSEADPCWEPYHHAGDHRTRSGLTWPIGGVRP
jgi:hypothetical protein